MAGRRTPFTNMNSQQVLQATEQSVALVDAKLTELTTLETNISDLQSEITSLEANEQELLQGDSIAGEKKVKRLVEARVRIDVAKADCGKLLLEAEGTRDELYFLGVRATNWIGSIQHGLSEIRKAKAVAQLREILAADKIGNRELEALAAYSQAVAEVIGNETMSPWVQSRPDLALDNCKKLRAIFNRLAAMVEAEEAEIDFIVSPAWLEAVQAPAAAPFSKDVQFAGGKS
jgi:hypothetical protein